MADKKLRVGMVGVWGFGGARRGLMRKTGLFEIAACYDINPTALEKACAEEGAAAVGSYDELLKVPRLEGMVISTGADTHADFSIRAMEAGLHVFVEKPLCCSVEEVRRLLEAQRRTGRVVGVGHNDNAGDAVIATARQYMEDGRIGTAACYEENSSHSGGLEIGPGAWRGDLERNPGGMLFQCGVHCLHRLVGLFGPIRDVSALFRYDAHPDTRTADTASVLIRHESGMVGTLSNHHVTAYVHEFRLFGTKGNLYVDTTARRGWYQQRKRGEVETRQEIPLAEPPARDTSNLENWYRPIRQGGQACPSLRDGIRAVLPVFAAVESDRTGRRINLKEFLGDLADLA